MTLSACPAEGFETEYVHPQLLANNDGGAVIAVDTPEPTTASVVCTAEDDLVVQGGANWAFAADDTKRRHHQFAVKGFAPGQLVSCTARAEDGNTSYVSWSSLDFTAL